MISNAQRIEVWAVTLEDRPGAATEKLLALAKAGAGLEFIIARRTPEQPGQGVLYVAPITGERQVTGAKAAGFTVAEGLHAVRIEGPDEPGVGHMVTHAVAEIGLNMRGLSAARVDRRYVMYMAFDNEADAEKALDRMMHAV